MEKRTVFRTHFLQAIRSSRVSVEETTDEIDEIGEELLFLENFAKFKHEQNKLNI